MAGSALAVSDTGADRLASVGTSRTRGRAPAYGAGVAIVVLAWGAMMAQAIPMLAERKIRESQQDAANGKFNDGISAARTAMRVEPWAAEPKLQLALLHQKALQPTPAVQYAREAADAEPVNWRNWAALADIYTWAKEDTNADGAIRRALRLNPRSQMLRARVNALPSSQAPAATPTAPASHKAPDG
jgi:Flp pilus assembly protein TadD